MPQSMLGTENINYQGTNRWELLQIIEREWHRNKRRKNEIRMNITETESHTWICKQNTFLVSTEVSSRKKNF